MFFIFIRHASRTSVRKLGHSGQSDMSCIVYLDQADATADLELHCSDMMTNAIDARQTVDITTDDIGLLADMLILRNTVRSDIFEK